MSDGHPGERARVELGYGRRRIEFEYDPARFDILAPGRPEGPVLTDADLGARLDAPIGSAPLGSIVNRSDRILVVVPDATRACGASRVAPLLVERLRAHGVPAGGIEFLVGGGTHRAPTPEEVEWIVGAEIARGFRVHSHDASDEASHVTIGTTSRGTPVEVDRRVVDADHVILVGAIGFHYFAGFSGGRKGFLPGCASERAIRANHLRAFDPVTLAKTEGVESGRLEGNAVSEDMEEASALFGRAFLVNTVLDAEDRIVGLYTGHWREAHRRGCADYLGSHTVRAERRPIVVVSCGGAPRDVNMIQSHKALEHARFVLDDCGDLILLAECPEGLGRPGFLEWFLPGGAQATARKLVEDYKLYGQTAWGIRWKAESYRVRLVSALDPETVRRMGMIPQVSLDEAVRNSRPGRGWILPNGLSVLPVPLDAHGGRAAAGA